MTNGPNQTGFLPPAPPCSRAAGPAAMAAALLLCAGLGWAVWRLPEPHAAVPELVRTALPSSGVQNPVTAVLLNFRGYDTLLEVAVLLLAAIAAAAVNGTHADRAAGAAQAPLFLEAFFRFIAPVAIIVAGYVLWVGKHAPGGAFQAGAILAAVGILAVLASGFTTGTGSRRENLLLVLGLSVFCAVGLATMAGSQSFLQYPRRWAGSLILLIESAATLSIAMALVALFNGCLRGPSARRHPRGAGSGQGPAGNDR